MNIANITAAAGPKWTEVAEPPSTSLLEGLAMLPGSIAFKTLVWAFCIDVNLRKPNMVCHWLCDKEFHSEPTVAAPTGTILL